MAAKFVSEKNLRFLLYDVFDAESLDASCLFPGTQQGNLRHGLGYGP